MENGKRFSFELPTRIEFGRGVVEELGRELRQLGARKVLVVTDDTVKTLDFFTGIEAMLEKTVTSWSLFDRVEANPKDYNVDQGAQLARDLGIDCLIALGGGSPVDCAKAISVTAAFGPPVRQYSQPESITERGLPVVAIPTTAGTGSEITFSSVITDSREHFKFTIKSPLIGPVVALLDPDLTVSMPPPLTASTGMDAMAHAVEAYTAIGAEPISDSLALHAVELIAANLSIAYQRGEDVQARSNMLMGSLLAGMAFSHSDVTAVHCLAEALGGVYDLPHGVCNAIILPEVVAYNRDYAHRRYDRLARAAGITTPQAAAGHGADQLVSYLRALLTELQLPSLDTLGVKKEDMYQLAGMAAANGSNSSNPRPMTTEDYSVLLETLLGMDVE